MPTRLVIRLRLGIAHAPKSDRRTRWYAILGELARRMFSGFKSRWVIPLLCRKRRPRVIWRRKILLSNSVTVSCRRMNENKSPPDASSLKIYLRLLVGEMRYVWGRTLNVVSRWRLCSSRCLARGLAQLQVEEIHLLRGAVGAGHRLLAMHCAELSWDCDARFGQR